MGIPIPGLFALGVIDGALSGLAAIGQGKARRAANQRTSDALAKQQDIIQTSLENIQTFITDQTDITNDQLNDALGRLGTLIDNTKQETRDALQLGIDSSITQMQDAYGWTSEDMAAQLSQFNNVMEKESREFRNTWSEGFRKMEDGLARGRLLRSGFGTTMGQEALDRLQLGEEDLAEKRSGVQNEYARQLGQLGSKLQSNLKAANMEGAARIAQAMSALSLEGGTREQQLQSDAAARNLQLATMGIEAETDAARQTGLLDVEIAGLETEGNPLADFFGGFAGSNAASNIATSLIPRG